MTIHAFPTFHCSPSHLKPHLHLHAPAITATYINILPTSASQTHGNSAFTVFRAVSKHLVPRSNNPAAAPVPTSTDLESGANVVRKFYRGINGRDLTTVEDLIAVNCIYEDLVFPKPFIGRKAILDFFNQFIGSISRDLQFAIDDISEENSFAVGVTWHLEWKGKAFPFSRGCSFYRLDVIDGQRQIVYGRDCVEPAIKPGDAALGVIRGVTWLLEKFPSLADRL
ncbi:hypothetical protein CASFOL_016547 [Castilleja foliolosa]|uniref:SnoaL-like domain-containing protein n=1 Tax=Castilleja foliolosa TaxID=1961234 RepID=A0ABD3D8I5_9LAMI